MRYNEDEMRDSKSHKILVVDDNPEIREVVNILLSNEGYEIEEACDGLEALEKINHKDLIILDIMMPDMDGYEVCKRIRDISNAPILFLTAKTMEGDKTLGFSCGGDDYLAKPFSYAELLSRVKALLRRYTIYKGKEIEKNSSVLEAYQLKVNVDTQQVLLNEDQLALTDLEYRILVLLMANPRKVFSNQELYESVWQEPYLYTANNTIMVHIRNLRKKLDVNPQNPLYIKTVWGKGYRFE